MHVCVHRNEPSRTVQYIQARRCGVHVFRGKYTPDNEQERDGVGDDVIAIVTVGFTRSLPWLGTVRSPIAEAAQPLPRDQLADANRLIAIRGDGKKNTTEQEEMRPRHGREIFEQNIDPAHLVKRPPRRYSPTVSTCSYKGSPSNSLSSAMNVSSVDACALLCNAHALCSGFDTDGARCFLKDGCTVESENPQDLCVNRGGWCGFRLRPERPLSSTVVVSQTHLLTTALLARFLLAQRQLTAGGARYYVAFLIGDEPTRDRCADKHHPRAHMLVALRTALGRKAVWCIDPGRFEKQWPGFFARSRQLPLRHQEWRSRLPAAAQPDKKQHKLALGSTSRNSLGFNWAWVNCERPF